MIFLELLAEAATGQSSIFLGVAIASGTVELTKTGLIGLASPADALVGERRSKLPPQLFRKHNKLCDIENNLGLPGKILPFRPGIRATVAASESPS